MKFWFLPFRILTPCHLIPLSKKQSSDTVLWTVLGFPATSLAGFSSMLCVPSATKLATSQTDSASLPSHVMFIPPRLFSLSRLACSSWFFQIYMIIALFTIFSSPFLTPQVPPDACPLCFCLQSSSTICITVNYWLVCLSFRLRVSRGQGHSLIYSYLLDPKVINM